MTTIATWSNHTTEDVTRTVLWSSGRSDIATIGNGDNAGQLTAVSHGTVTISASLDGHQVSTTVTITAARIVSIAITPDNPSVARGLLLRLSAIATFTDGTTQNVSSQALWDAVPASIVSVGNQPGSQGEAYALAEGTATVTATLNDVTGTTRITVPSAVLLGLSIGPGDATVQAGLTRQFTATGIYSDQSVRDVTAQAHWESSDQSVANISNATGSQGLATAAAAGATTIRATVDYFTSEAALTVEEPPALPISPSSPRAPR